ncbi:ChaC-like protein-domain-containing protein [Trametes maxima]|nr:ChaC-like protein-domain-containing protein [Trametes maxima]
MASTGSPNTVTSADERPYVVFGYGSLIFKPHKMLFHAAPGFLKGYVRRFAQKSHDHRGTPENPGRVVTLVHKEDWDHVSALDPFPDDNVVWGVAHTIDPAHAAEVRDYLGRWCLHDGYTLEEIDIYGLEDGHEKCYVGRPDNPSFIGSEPIDQLAERIWHSVGPSGPNKEYLYRLAEAVRRLAPESHDSHLFELEVRGIRLQRELQQADSSITLSRPDAENWTLRLAVLAASLVAAQTNYNLTCRLYSMKGG